MEPDDRLQSHQPGLDHCYAETLFRLLRSLGQRKHVNGFGLTRHPDTLESP